MGFTINLTWKGSSIVVYLRDEDPELGELGRAIETQAGASYETIKLLLSGKKGFIAPAQKPEQRASEAGLVSGCKALLMASSAEDVTQVRAARDLTGLRGFDDELKRAARRRRTAASSAILQPPKAEFTFGAYETWQRPGLRPPHGDALKLLYRLANDPGILGIMAAHRYHVRLLSEMPPEGKVGVSPVCILGVNVNAGQEISLRLRTDDLKGFRKFERIRETLIHELAHMEYGEHDNDFKQLNSQLTRECAAIHSRHSASRSLLRDLGLTADDDEGLPSRVSELDAVLLEDEDDVMTATARLSGRTLRQLAAAGAAAASGGDSLAATGVAAGMVAAAGAATRVLGNGASSTPAARAAAVAALLRTQLPQQAALAEHAEPLQFPLQISDPVVPSVSGGGGSGRSSGDGDAGDGGDRGGGDGIEREFEHYDAVTEQAEEAARRLAEPATAEEAEALSSRLGEDGTGIGSAPAVLHAGGSTGTPRSNVVKEGSVLGTPEVMKRRQDVEAADGAAATGNGGVVEVLRSPRQMDVDSLATAAVAAAAAVPPVVPPVVVPPSNTDSMTAPLPPSPLRPADGDGSTALTARAQLQKPPPPPPLPLILTPPPELFLDDATSATVADQDHDVVQEVVRSKARQAWTALSQLVASASPSAPSASSSSPPPSSASAFTISAADVLLALETLETLLGNAAQLPQEERYRRVRLGNVALQRRLGRLP
ncbi:hypothetical protein Agub_g10748, partial [Astrephomene gubernaculifera]